MFSFLLFLTSSSFHSFLSFVMFCLSLGTPWVSRGDKHRGKPKEAGAQTLFGSPLLPSGRVESNLHCFVTAAQTHSLVIHSQNSHKGFQHVNFTQILRSRSRDYARRQQYSHVMKYENSLIHLSEGHMSSGSSIAAPLCLSAVPVGTVFQSLHWRKLSGHVVRCFDLYCQYRSC